MNSVHEPDRLAALQEFNILDSLPEQGYADVVELASQICQTPIAQISFIDSDRQWIKATVGVPAVETPRVFSFCAHTISTGASLIVADASADPRFQNNPLVLGPPHIRAYAGSPIIDKENHVLGTVCVLDTVPHVLSASQISSLKALSRQVMLLLEERKRSLAEKRDVQYTLDQSQRSLAMTAERLQLSQVAGRIASWEWHLGTDALTWSGGTEWVYGRPASELASLEQVLPFLHPEDVPKLMEALKPALAGTGGYSFEFRVFWPDGSMHWSQSFGKPVLSAGGDVERITGVHMDITPRKSAEEQLRESEKIAAVGRLSSSIAHELSNPLASVTNLLFLAQASDTLEEIRELLTLAREEVGRASVIANQTLRFHKQSPRKSEMSLPDVISGVLLLSRSRLVSNDVRLQRRDRVARSACCFEGEIRQLLSNLVGNAIDAMTAIPKNLYLRSREGTDWRTGRKGQFITVADSGTGMSKESVAKAFQAFYTTKELCGTGLGLWITKEIVNRHEGQISVKSSQAPGRTGTVFVIFLPF